MKSTAKKIIEFSKKPLNEKLGIQFVNYLKDHFHKKELIDLAEQIDWLPITKLFEIEFAKLWKKMIIPNEIKELEKLKISFSEQILNNIRVRLFQFTYYTLISYNDEKLKRRKLSDVMNEHWDFDMYELFRVFDLQFSLTSLNNNNDKKNIIRDIEELKRRSEHSKKLAGGKYDEKNLKLYRDIYKKNDENINSGLSGNYLEATKCILGNPINKKGLSKYKAFNRFKNKFQAYTYKDFKELNLLTEE